jgi:hypothetical protein
MRYKPQKNAYKVYFLLGIALLIPMSYLIAVGFFQGFEATILILAFLAPVFLLLFLLLALIALVMSLRGKAFLNERKATGQSDLLGLGLSTIFYFSGWGLVYSNDYWHLLEVGEASSLALILTTLSVPYALLCIVLSARHYFGRK